jgi:hypothetical protein
MIVPPGIPPGSSYFVEIAIGEGLIPLLVSPVLLFYLFYRLGKGVVLPERYLGVSASIFLGGAIGYTVSYFLSPFALGSVWSSSFPDLAAEVATAFDFFLLFLNRGFDTMFPAFVAIAFANYRIRKQSAPGPRTSKAYE